MVDLIKVARPVMGEAEIEAVAEVLRSERYVSGPRVLEFEKQWAAYIGTEHAVAVDTGTDAIRLTLQALGIGPGDEVVVPALTFFATASAVLMVGATPIFGDIDPDTYCLDFEDTCNKLNKETKAIIPVSYFGHPADMGRFEDFGIGERTFIIEDAAQAHGAEYKHRKCGSFGDAGTWSFYATKNITVATEGGMVTTNDGALVDTLRILRSHGMVGRDSHVLLGGNNRMNEIAAAIGLVQLRHLDEWNAKRDQHSRFLRRKLARVPWLKIPPVKDYCTAHAWFWCCVEVDEERLGMDTNMLRTRLLEQGVETRHRYQAPLYKQPVMERFRHLHDYSENLCPVAERVAGRLIGLPNHPLLKREELAHVVDVIRVV